MYLGHDEDAVREREGEEYLELPLGAAAIITFLMFSAGVLVGVSLMS